VGGASLAAPPGEKFSANENEVNFMKGFKAGKVLSALLMAVAMAMFVCGAAFAAVGDTYLGDFNTIDSVRPNTYDGDYGGAPYQYDLKIVKLVEDANGDYIPTFFASASDADPANFIWSLNTAQNYNGDFDPDDAVAAYDSDAGGWYYSLTVENDAVALGPESWRLTYLPSSYSGDFSFVGTEFSSYPEYPVTAYNIGIEYQDNYQIPATFATGSFEEVQYIDDYAPYGSHERTYATALDAVARSMQVSPPVIHNYSKTPGKQLLAVVSDDIDVGHKGLDVNSGFMYAVYKPSSANPTQYTRDDSSERIGPDDYLLSDGDYILWAIGHLYAYDEYFPSEIERVADDAEAETEELEYGIGY
jgi:hypothetical protein